jgi:hypothetical protein
MKNQTPLTRLEANLLLLSYIFGRPIQFKCAGLNDCMIAAINTLTPREQRCIRYRFAILDGHYHTLKNVGLTETPPVSAERIRQIEAKALRKLRHPNRSHVMMQFFTFTNKHPA